MADRNEINALFEQQGYSNYTWIKADDIIVAQWVRFKCMFGCPHYAINATCPPHVPSVAECREFVRDYREAVIFHFTGAVDQPEDRTAWCREINLKLLEVERRVFLAGYYKAFIMFTDDCAWCRTCIGSREKCVNKTVARPSPEALAIDVFDTVRTGGLSIGVLTDYTQAMDRYAILLIE